MLTYSRNVDDIFILWKNQSMAKDLEKYLTKDQYGLKLKTMQENREVVNYLDVKMIVTDEGLDTTVYTKPTSMPVLIPSWSYDP